MSFITSNQSNEPEFSMVCAPRGWEYCYCRQNIRRRKEEARAKEEARSKGETRSRKKNEGPNCRFAPLASVSENFLRAALRLAHPKSLLAPRYVLNSCFLASCFLLLASNLNRMSNTTPAEINYLRRTRYSSPVEGPHQLAAVVVGIAIG